MVGVLEKQAPPVLRRRERLDASTVAAVGTVGSVERLRGLDGIRGLAVVAVVLFHLWPRLAPAGFIGVSVFFTLSGFVITRGLLVEHDRTGRISLGSFWARRIRRLWPAATLTLATVVVVWSVAGWTTRAVGRDIVASFLQVANWRYLVSGHAYGTGETPVAHFWSLAIEEQLYVVVPTVVWALRRHRRALGAVLVALICGSVATTLASAGDTTVVYYSTLTRSAELLAGALLAVATLRLPAFAARATRRRAAGLTGAAALAVLGWITVSASLGTAFLYEGGLALLAVPSVLALIGGIWSPGLVRALSVRPLQWLGAVSYGIYLIHWPLHVALTNTDIPTNLQPWLALGGTLVLAPMSFRWIEEPVRQRRVPPRLPLPAAITLTVAVLAGGLTIATAPAKAREIDFAGAIAQLRTSEKVAAAFPGGRPTLGEAPGPALASPPTTIAQAVPGTIERPARIGVFGDSTALMLGVGVERLDDPTVRVAGASVDLGCPLGRGGQLRGNSKVGNDPTTIVITPRAACDWGNWVTTANSAGGLDVGLVLLGNWDIAGRRVPELGDRWLTVGDPDYDSWLAAEMAAASDALHAAGVKRLVWLELPPDVGDASNGRIDRFNELVRANAAARPWITTVDYAAWLRSSGRDGELRPDTIHVTEQTGIEVARLWLNPILVEAARRGG